MKDRPTSTSTSQARGKSEERLVGADRVVAVLMELAAHPNGVTLDELASALKSSKPTVHRALATLRRAGLANMLGHGVYILGDEYLRLAFRNIEGRPETARLQPLLEQLASDFGETAHYAVLSGREIVYRAKMDPPHGAVRLTSVVGGRNPAYSTAVGKALLSQALLDLDAVKEWFGPFPLERITAKTLVEPQQLNEELEATRMRGYGTDNQENEQWINCIAIPVHLDGAQVASGGISVSAVSFRTPIESLIDRVPRIRETIVDHLGPSSIR